MKKELLIVMVVVGCNALQASGDDQFRDLRRNVSQSFLDNVCQQLNDNRSESRISSDSQYEFESIENAMQEALEAEQEKAFYSSPEVKKAFHALLSGLDPEIALQTIRNAFNHSPTIKAISTLEKKLNFIYWYDTPYVKQLESQISDGGRTGAERGISQQKLNDHRKKNPSFLEKCYTTPSPCSYGSSLSSSRDNTPINFNAASGRK